MSGFAEPTGPKETGPRSASLSRPSDVVIQACAPDPGPRGDGEAVARWGDLWPVQVARTAQQTAATTTDTTMRPRARTPVRGPRGSRIPSSHPSIEEILDCPEFHQPTAAFRVHDVTTPRRAGT